MAQRTIFIHTNQCHEEHLDCDNIIKDAETFFLVDRKIKSLGSTVYSILANSN